MQTMAELLALALGQAGIEHVFGLPGGENIALVEALRQQGIRFVLVHNENSALFMADATARLTGKPGVCLTTLGPGATNAMAGVAHAYLDRAPVLVITAQSAHDLLPDYTHQVLNLEALFTPITKGSFDLRATNAHQVINYALELTMSGRPGPVHLRLSQTDATQPVLTTPSPLIEQPSQAIDLSDMSKARQLLSKAHHPVLVVGLGLEPEAPYAALQQLAEVAHAPVIMLPKSKGALAADHALAVGTLGLTHHDPAYEILEEADCVVAVGFDVVELVKPWKHPAPLIWIAPWPNEDPKLPALAEFVGPMTPILQQLSELSFMTTSDWGENRVATFRQSLNKKRLPSPAAGRMAPQTVLQALHQSLPRDILLTTDVGAHKILAGLTWPAYTPNRFLLSNGLSCMGFALPAAIAASLALGKQATVCLIGDGGMAMVMGELGLLTRLELPVIVVVMNDSALDLIRSKQQQSGYPIFGTEFSNPDFTTIGKAYRMQAMKVSNEAECMLAIKKALATKTPTLIEAMIDPISYPTNCTTPPTDHPRT